MRLFELNTNPQPGGGMCVLCGGSVRFVVDTDDEPLLTRAEWEASMNIEAAAESLWSWPVGHSEPSEAMKARYLKDATRAIRAAIRRGNS